jgi:hypothetical protein
MTIRVLVCGGRDYADHHAVKRALDVLLLVDDVVIIHGAARGADTLAADWGRLRAAEVLSFPAAWRRHDGSIDRGAGHKRNAQMLVEGRPDLIVAFPGGRGTADMVARGRAAGVPVWAQ